MLDPRIEFDHYQTELRQCVESGVLPELNTQEQLVLVYIRQGFPQAVAARMAGMTVAQLMEFRGDPRFEISLEFTLTRKATSLEITKDMLNYMALEAHGFAKDATEMVKAIDLMAKLNGLYPGNAPKGRVIDGAVEDKTGKTMRHLQQMSDGQLLQQAGFDDLDPTPIDYEE